MEPILKSNLCKSNLGGAASDFVLRLTGMCCSRLEAEALGKALLVDPDVYAALDVLVSTLEKNEGVSKVVHRNNTAVFWLLKRIEKNPMFFDIKNIGDMSLHISNGDLNIPYTCPIEFLNRYSLSISATGGVMVAMTEYAAFRMTWDNHTNGNATIQFWAIPSTEATLAGHSSTFQRVKLCTYRDATIKGELVKAIYDMMLFGTVDKYRTFSCLLPPFMHSRGGNR